MFDRQELKQRADAALQRTDCDPKRLLLIHLGAVTAISLLLTVVSYFLQEKIDTIGGLSGIGLRSALSTAVAVLQLLFFVLTPFWQLGYRSVSLSLARGKSADTNNLFAGFRVFGAALRLYLLLALIFGGLFIACNYLSSFLYMMTPWGRALSDQLSATLELAPGTLSNEAILDTFADYAIGLLVLNGLLFLAFAIPVFYRIRLSLFRVMEGQPRALVAILESKHLTKGCGFALFKLDLSFWWYYLGKLLIGFIAYADIFLELAGHPLSWHPVAVFFVTYLCHLALHFGFQLWQKNRVAVTYALAYDALRQAKEAPQQPR